MHPSWYGIDYPTLEDLEHYAHSRGALVAFGDVPVAVFAPPNAVEDGSPPLILVPSSAGHLERVWLLSHEIGHLLQHSGSVPERRAGKVEFQADRWAAQALIPQSAVLRYQNASVDAFIGALSKHYEDIPLEDCPQRRLAAKIARIRLLTLREVA